MADVRIPFTWVIDPDAPAGSAASESWVPGHDTHEIPVTIEIGDTPANRHALRRLGRPDPVARATAPASDDDTAANEEQLGSLIETEAGGQGLTTETAVGYTVLTRMRRNRVKRVAAVWKDYGHNKIPDRATKDLAGRILRE